MLSDGLRDQGYHVIEACDADEALTILNTAIPDIIISDVRMPGSLDGLELLRTIRKTQTTLPVIIMSGHLGAAQAKAEGATEFMGKPYSMEAMYEVVRELLGEPA
jgi:DNA-binding NtrC family response regulator